MVFDNLRYAIEDTIIAPATPSGRSAIAIVRLSGKQAFEIARTLFRMDDETFLTISPGTMKRMKIWTADGRELIDDALIVLYQAPRSYTGEDIVEFFLHGNPLLVERLIREALRCGARPAQPGEFTFRAFLHGKMSLLDAEALHALIQARSPWQIKTARKQMDPAFVEKLREWKSKLLELLTWYQASIEFGETDPIPYTSDLPPKDILNVLMTELEHLIESYNTGRVLQEGYRVLILGKPNAGKSSLFNALLKEPRAIVTPVEGTTRDYLSESLVLEGHLVELIDSAGVRETNELVERIGVERTLKLIENADCLFLIFDGSVPLSEEDRYLVRSVPPEKTVCVINKIDLPQVWDALPYEALKTRPLFRVSAKTGEGMNELISYLIQQLKTYDEEFEHEGIIIANVRHKECLERAKQALSRALEHIEYQTEEPILVLELEEALKALDSLTEITDIEDILDRIFSKFCIGK